MENKSLLAIYFPAGSVDRVSHDAHVDRLGLLVMLLVMLSGCVSVPPEAPALSEQLGSRLSEIESAHLRLVEDFFTDKRARVDEYIDAV